MRLAPLFGLLALAPAGAQEPLHRVRIAARDPAREAAALEALGFDVLAGAGGPDALELVVTAAEEAALERRGLAPEVLEVGQPFALLQAADGVPGGYPDLAEVEARLALAEAAYPGLARVVDLTAAYGGPPTVEGRHLLALKLSDHVALEEDEPAALVVGAHHSREVVTPVIALHLIESWLALYGSDPEVTALLDAHELWVAPVWNPDGYEHVFTVDHLWRKNRRVFPTGIGVDLNRNYPQGWDAPCAGDDSPSSSTYKGPLPGSEIETLTLLVFAADLRFARTLDLHSAGREVLWGYKCLAHPFAAFLQSEAVELSLAAGYGGAERPPSAEGEQFEYGFAQQGAHAFLIETALEFQPPYAEALAEAEQLLPAFRHMLERPAAVEGHVRDACTGKPLGAGIELVGVPFENGESNASGGDFGRYHVFAPPGELVLAFSRPGYATAQHVVQAAAGAAVVLDVALAPAGGIEVQGIPKPGKTLALHFAMPADPGAFYAAGASLSGTVPGFLFGGCTLPLNPDGVTWISLASQPPFSGFSGFLDAAGHAAGALAIPDTPAVVGVELDFAFATLDPLSGAPLHPSGAEHVVVVP